jgi:hypothetical protein
MARTFKPTWVASAWLAVDSEVDEGKLLYAAFYLKANSMCPDEYVGHGVNGQRDVEAELVRLSRVPATMPLVVQRASVAPCAEREGADA